jgi:hypothetical protein
MTRVFVSADLPEGVGRLAEITAKIAEKGINIKGFVADRDEIRFLVDDPEAVKRVLAAENIKAREHEVFEVTLPNEPGALARVTRALAESGVELEGAFGFAGDSHIGHLFIDVNDVEKATGAIESVPDRVATR